MPKGDTEWCKGKKHHNNYRREYLKKEVYNALANGATYSNVQNMLQEDYWQVGWKPCINTAQMILKQVKDQIREDWKEDRKTLKEQIYANFMDLYNECREMGDRGTALNTLKEIGKLGGIYEAENINLNVKGEIEIDFGLGNED